MNSHEKAKESLDKLGMDLLVEVMVTMKCSEVEKFLSQLGKDVYVDFFDDETYDHLSEQRHKILSEKSNGGMHKKEESEEVKAKRAERMKTQDYLVKEKVDNFRANRHNLKQSWSREVKIEEREMVVE